MPKKFAITADLHYGIHKQLDRLNADGQSERLKGISAAFRHLCDVAAAQGADTLFIAGDLLDCRRNIPAEVAGVVISDIRYAVMRCLLKVYIIQGNHEYLNEKYSVLDIFSNIPNVKLVFSEPTHIELSGIDISMCGWSPDMVQKLANDKADILISHAQVAGAKAGGYVTDHGIDPDWLEKRYGLSFLGDYHRPQYVSPTVCYVGSPLHLTFGESGNPQQISIVSQSSVDEVSVAAPHVPTFVTVNVTKTKDLIPIFSKTQRADTYYWLKCSDATVKEAALESVKKYVERYPKKDGRFKVTVDHIIKRESHLDTQKKGMDLLSLAKAYIDQNVNIADDEKPQLFKLLRRYIRKEA